MIQLSDYDYPIMINPVNFLHHFKSLPDHQYAENLKVSLFLQDCLKNVVVQEKTDQAGILQK